MVEAVVVRRVAGGQYQRVLEPGPGRNRQPDAVVHVALGKQCVRFAVVGAECDPLGAVP